MAHTIGTLSATSPTTISLVVAWDTGVPEEFVSLTLESFTITGSVSGARAPMGFVLKSFSDFDLITSGLVEGETITLDADAAAIDCGVGLPSYIFTTVALSGGSVTNSITTGRPRERTRERNFIA